MAMRSTAIVGAFSDTAMAERAVDALKDAGFSNDEIRYSGATTGGSFFDNLKSWFTGEAPAAKGDVVDDLKNIGLPENEADYYAREYAAGHPIVAVRATGREDEAMTVLRSNGSFQVSPGTAGAFNQSPGLGKEREYAQSSQYESQAGYSGQAEMRQGTGEYAQPADRPYDQEFVEPSLQDAAYERPVGPEGGINEPSIPPQPRDMSMADRDPGTTERTTNEQGQAVRLREEQLRAEKQRVQKGEVRMRKEVVEEQQNIDVPVRREEVVVERHPLGEPQPTDTPVGQDEVIRVPVSEEQVNVTKQPVEREEIGLKKREVEEQKRFTDTTRREKAHIEPTGDIPVQNQDLTDEERGL